MRTITVRRIGTWATGALDRELPADAAKADHERFKVVPRETPIRARRTLPEAECPPSPAHANGTGRFGTDRPSWRIRSSGHAGTATGAPGPTYRATGRMIFESSACSRMFALHPTTRPAANVGVNISRGRPHSSMTTPA